MCIRKKSQLLRINACVIFNLSYPFKYIYILYILIFFECLIVIFFHNDVMVYLFLSPLCNEETKVQKG